jgi:hypothetical protein
VLLLLLLLLLLRLEQILSCCSCLGKGRIGGRLLA